MPVTYEDIAQINTDIHDTLATAAGLLYTQNYDEITEGIPNTPLLQVYWQSKTTDAVSGSTDRTTFRGGVRQTDLVFIADLYLEIRGNINQIFPKMFPLLNALDFIFESQNVKPYFGNTAIKAFNWQAEKATFVYERQDGTELKYPGVRFTIGVRVF